VTGKKRVTSRIQETEADVLLRCRAGDEEAFTGLVERYRKPVLALAFDLLGDPDDAEDAAQEVFVSVYRSLPLFREEASFFSWLYRITVRVCCRLREKRSRNKVLPLVGESDLRRTGAADPWVMLAEGEKRRQVRAAVASLSPPYREVVVLRHFHDLSYREIATMLKVPVGTVMSRLSAARRKLRDLLEKELTDEL
jgi:RNA polymerase sigma-70 factor (ECF subfamily)